MSSRLARADIAPGRARGIADPGLHSSSTRPPALLAGAVLANRYRLTATLGTGDVATVYRADDFATGRVIAIKVFHDIGRDDRTRVESFHRSASRAAAPAELPSAFVAVYDCDLTDRGQLFLVTELVEGPSLVDLIEAKPGLDTVRALGLGVRVGEALASALGLGFPEFRMAPAEIVITNDADSVKVLDSDGVTLLRIGLADQLRSAEAQARDPRYTSPEELAGRPTTEQSAVYRFGILLRELLYGGPPAEESPAAARGRHARQPPLGLQARHRPLPSSLYQLVSRMVDPDPLARPTDVTLIVNELWDARCHLQSKSSAPAGALNSPVALSSRARGLGFPTRRWAVSALTVFAAVAGALMTRSYVGWDHASVPLPPLSVQAPEHHPEATGPSPESPTTSSANDGGASPRVGDLAPSPPADLRPEPSTRPPLSPAAPPAQAPVLADATESRRVPVAKPESRPIQRDLTQSLLSETPVPPVRPIRPSVGEPRGADPGAIIDWLLRESPRLVRKSPRIVE